MEDSWRWLMCCSRSTSPDRPEHATATVFSVAMPPFVGRVLPPWSSRIASLREKNLAQSPDGAEPWVAKYRCQRAGHLGDWVEDIWQVGVRGHVTYVSAYAGDCVDVILQISRLMSMEPYVAISRLSVDAGFFVDLIHANRDSFRRLINACDVNPDVIGIVRHTLQDFLKVVDGEKVLVYSWNGP